jgi:hypothetical protein
MKIGNLKSIIKIDKAYDQILNGLWESSGLPSINKSQLVDILNKKYNREERDYIFEELSKIFDARYLPDNKKYFVKNRTLYNLCSNSFGTSWLLPILVLGHAKEIVEKEKEHIPLDSRTVDLLVRTGIAPGVDGLPSIAKEYRKILDTIYKFWLKEKDCLIKVSRSKSFFEDYGEFERAFIQFSSREVQDVRGFRSYWLSPKASLFGRFIQEISTEELYDIFTIDKNGKMCKKDNTENVEKLYEEFKNYKNPEWVKANEKMDG